MGAKFWSAEEKQVFIDIIVPMSTEADKNNSTGEKLSWDQLVPVMQAEMDKRGGTRVYSKNSLFQHYYQKVGPRARRRGEADTMTVPSKAPQRGRNGGRNAHAGNSKRNVRDNAQDEYEYDMEDDAADLEPFQQYITRKDASRVISKAGRFSLFVENTDEEDEADKIRQANAQYGNPKYDESVWRPNNDLLDDENDIPGKSEDEAYEAEQHGNKNGHKKSSTKQNKGPSVKRPRHSLNATIDDDYDEKRHVPRSRPVAASNARSRGINRADEAEDEFANDELISSKANIFSARARQPNKSTSAGKPVVSHRKALSLDDDDSDSDDRPYESPYQQRATHASSFQGRGSQTMGPRYNDNTSKQLWTTRVGQAITDRHSIKDEESFGYTEMMSGPSNDGRARASASGYLSAEEEPSQTYAHLAFYDQYSSQDSARERLRKFDLTDEGVGRFPTSHMRYQPPSNRMNHPADQGQGPGFNPRSSFDAASGDSVLGPRPREHGGAHCTSFSAFEPSKPPRSFTPALLRNPYRKSPETESIGVGADTEVWSPSSTRIQR